MTLAAQLTKYILAAMISWVPLSAHLVPGANGLLVPESELSVQARYEATAADIAAVVLDPNEPHVFRGSDHGDKEALELAAIGSFEGGFNKFVEDGDCNKKDYHADRRGTCDGGNAFSNWQIHIFGNGYILGPDGSLTSVDAEKAKAKALNTAPSFLLTDIIQGPQLLSDHRLAARVALRLVRFSWKNYSSLCGFTGEDCGEGRTVDDHLIGGHPKARQRHQRAVDYGRVHPFVFVPDTPTTPATVD